MPDIIQTGKTFFKRFERRGLFATGSLTALLILVFILILPPLKNPPERDTQNGAEPPTGTHLSVSEKNQKILSIIENARAAEAEAKNSRDLLAAIDLYFSVYNETSSFLLPDVQQKIAELRAAAEKEETAETEYQKLSSFIKKDLQNYRFGRPIRAIDEFLAAHNGTILTREKSPEFNEIKQALLDNAWKSYKEACQTADTLAGQKDLEQIEKMFNFIIENYEIPEIAGEAREKLACYRQMFTPQAPAPEK